MPLSVHQFPCLDDNYGFLIRDEVSGLVASIDAPDADEILRQADALGWPIDRVLNTHWHHDHIGGNAAIAAATRAKIVAPDEVATRAGADIVIRPGDVVALGETRLQVLDVGGHTLGHIAYYDEADAMAFVGDALFPMGCGRMFEGDAAQMWASLQRLARLPQATMVYCAHEYAAANARFALFVDADAGVAARAQAIFQAREEGRATVPTTIGAETATNPFLRAPGLRPSLSPAEAFGELRRLKDGFRG